VACISGRRPSRDGGRTVPRRACKLVSLLPGATDVSRLSAGVYFLPEGPQASDHKEQAITVSKVLILR